MRREYKVRSGRPAAPLPTPQVCFAKDILCEALIAEPGSPEPSHKALLPVCDIRLTSRSIGPSIVVLECAEIYFAYSNPFPEKQGGQWGGGEKMTIRVFMTILPFPGVYSIPMSEGPKKPEVPKSERPIRAIPLPPTPETVEMQREKLRRQAGELSTVFDLAHAAVRRYEKARRLKKLVEREAEQADSRNAAYQILASAEERYWNYRSTYTSLFSVKQLEPDDEEMMHWLTETRAAFAGRLEAMT